MKVVLFCGGLGMRLRDYSDQIPKPLVPIGPRPIIWHLMKYYAKYGHKEFILCLGYRGNAIKDYFLKYDETVSNDFVLSEGGKKIDVLQHDISDWKITFVDTGMHVNIGQRLLRVKRYVKDDEMFMANYADGLTDMPLDAYVDEFRKSQAVASFMATRTSQSLHCVHSDTGGVVTSFGQIAASEFWINAGFFCMRPSIFDHIEEGDELVEKPFQRLIDRKALNVHRYDGFWQQMDTFKEKIIYDRMEAQGKCPWMLWKKA
jgi:glucose-1-phosphate cytidylyltransferase